MEKIELKIPNLGEAESTEIIEVNIEPGKEVSLNDPLIVLESEKAAMEIPSDFQGKIKEVLIKEGDKVSEGMVFATMNAVKEETAKVEEKDTKKDKQTSAQKGTNETLNLFWNVQLVFLQIYFNLFRATVPRSGSPARSGFKQI